MPDVRSAIVGTRFRGEQAMAAVGKMRPGDAVQLVREADNSHDANAVACHYLGIHCGYVPRQANPAVARALDAGSVLTARVETAPLFSGRRLQREPTITISWDGAR